MEYYPKTTSDLITAINNANQAGGSNTIHLSANKVYTLSTVQDTGDANGDSGLPAITSNITIKGNNATLRRADSAPLFRILRITSSADDAEIEGVRFLNGKLGMLGHGAGIKNAGILTLRYTLFQGNQAGDNNGGYGGAILNNGTTIRIFDSEIVGNRADSEGGGIYNVNNKNTLILNTIIRSNQATVGGGVFSAGGLLRAEDCHFEANTGDDGGAIRLASGGALIKRSTITNNTANNSGAALYLSEWVGSFDSVVFEDCRIFGNVSQNKEVFDFYNDNTSITVDARNNYWGAADGPSGAFPGTGDSVSSDVLVSPFVVSDEIPHEPGSTPDGFICVPNNNSINPIGLWEGEKRLIKTDISVQTPSGPLEFTRYYRQSKQANPLFQFMGLGWTHNHAFSLSLSGTSSNRIATVATPSGGTLNLSEVSTDMFEADAGAYAALEIDSGNYILTLQDKRVYIFNSSFEMVSRQLPNQQTWTYTYNSGLLVSIADEAGRGLQFAYDNDDHLVRVGDHDANLTPGSLSGRYIEFEYQNAKAKSTPDGDILATDKLLHKVYDVHQAAKPSGQKDPWIYVYYGQDTGETDTAQYNWLIERISPTPEAGATPISLEQIQYVHNQDAVVAEQSDSDERVSTEFNLVPGRTYTVEAEITVNSGTARMEVTGTSAFDVNSSGTGSQTLSKTISSWAGDAITRRHQVIVGAIGGASFTMQSITVTETDPDYHTIVQERGVVGTADPLETTTFVVQPNGHPQTLESRAGFERAHLFDRGLLIGEAVTIAGNDTLETTKSVNADFRPSTLADAKGQITYLNWGTDGRNLESVTDALSQTTSFQYDSQDRLIESTDAQGHTTEYTYGDSNAPRQPTVIRVLDGTTVLRRQEFTYDSKGRVLTEKLIDPDDEVCVLQQTTRVYGTSGNGDELLESLTVKDLLEPSNDVSTTYTYDSLGRVIKVQKSSMFGSCDVSYTVYDEAGNVVANICNYDPGANPAPTDAAEAAALYALVGDPDKNQVTTHAYDALNRRIATTVNAGTSFARTSRTVLDALGRVTRTIDNYVAQGSSAPVNWEWVSGQWEDGSSNAIDHGSDLTENIISDVAYNARGLVRLRRDVLGSVSLFGYDDANRLVKTVQNAATPAYDNDVTGDIDLSGYSEDSSSAAVDIITTQAYDAAGNLVKSVDARGSVTLTGLDALNRAVRVIRNASDPDYDYAADPQLVNYEISTDPDQDQLSTTEYDSLGRVIKTQTLLENRDVDVWDTMLYGYDALGRQVKSIQHASDPEYNLLADPDLSAYTSSGNADEDMVTETVYDAQGRVLYTVDGDGNKNWQVYDGLNRVVKTIQNASYTSGSPAPEDDTYLGALSEPDQDILSRTVFDSDGRVQRAQRVLRTNGAGTDLEWLYTLYGYDARGRQIKTVQNTSQPNYLDPDMDPETPPLDGDLSDYTPSGNSDEDITSETVFDEQGRVLKTIDTRGNVTLYGYDSIGRRIKMVQNASNDDYNDAGTDPDLSGYTPDGGATVDQDRISDTVYDLVGRVTQSIDVAGRVSLHVYDQLGRRMRTIANYVAQGTTDPADWEWSVSNSRWEDGLNNAIVHGAMAGDNDQNIISDTVYNKAGQVISSRDVRGTVTSFAYDAAGRRLQVTRAEGTSLETVDYTCFDKAGRVLRTIRNWDESGSPDAWDMSGDWVFDPSSHSTNNDENLITEFTYDKASRRVSSTNPAGDTSLTSYFKNGQVETMTDPEGTVTLYRYDALRRRTLVVQGYVAQGSSDPADWVWESGQWKQAPSGTAIQHGTDNDENIIVQVSYDKSGRMLALRDPGGNQTSYEYDLLSRRTLLTNPLTQEWETTYVDVGQTTQVTMTYPGLGSGTYNVQRGFDRLGRLTSIQYGDPANTSDVQFAYDAAGNRVTMTEFSGSDFTSPVRQTQYDYDERNRLTAVGFDSDGDTIPEETVTYAYDLAGNRTTLTLPGDLTVTYAYDEKGRLVSLEDWDEQESTFDYDDVDRHIETTRPNGIDSGYEYDLAGRLTRLFHSDGVATRAEFEYVVDGRGNRIQANERLMKPDMTLAEQTIVYGYDGLSRLTSAQYRDGFDVTVGTMTRDLSYGYDLAGNLVDKDGVTRTYNAANQMTNDGANTLTYDPNGNLTSDGINSYGWDRANRMVSSPGNTSYKYDGAGNRIQQTVSSVVTDYLNDLQPGLTKMLATTTGSNTERFIHGPRGIHAHQQGGVGSGAAVWGQSTWGSAVWGDAGSGGSSVWQYLLQDGLGSVRAEADDSADVLANQGYDPYGVPIDLNGSFDSPFSFTGEQTDSNGQVYLRARYYTPDMSIFTALDPWEGIPQRPMSLNGYLYVEGDPINSVDPDGLCPELNEPGLVNQADARQCHNLVGILRNWNVNVVWDETSVASLSCLPDTVQQVANQAQGVSQRWTTGEVRAIYNAFRIFAEAHDRFKNLNTANFISNRPEPSFNYDYAWPLSQSITIEKRRYAGWENVDLSIYADDPASSANPIGIHYYSGGNAETTRKIVMSASRWGSANDNMTPQSRSWLVLHEFMHIFSRDRLTARCGGYQSAEQALFEQATLSDERGGLDFVTSGSPTQYSKPGAPGSATQAFGQEYYTEAITGTVWNYGWQAVSGYTSDADGWYRENVLSIIGNDGSNLFTWVLNNVIGLKTCPV